MQRFKTSLAVKFLVFGGIALLVISLAKLAPVPASKTTISTITQEEILRHKTEVAKYKSQQRELKVAIKAYFDKAIASGVIVGAGVSIVRGDSIVISDGFGRRNINFNDKVDGETIFRLGSLSKGFAGILAANLEAGGKLEWEDKVIDHLPEFRFGDSINSRKITLAHILSHSSGAPYHSFTNLVEAGLPLKEIAGRFKEVTPISDPGQMYSYQNAMFALSWEVMSKASGHEIPKALQNRIFKPLGMSSTSIDHKTLVNSENVAIPHSRGRNRWKSLELTNSYYNAIFAGGINANAVDMGKWMRFLLGHKPEVMSGHSIKEAFNPFVEIKGGNKYYYHWPGHISSYYGFGWRIHTFKENSTDKEKTIWHHGGSVNNYRNEIALYPEADLGICVLLNSNSRLARTVIPDLYKIVGDIYNKAPEKLPPNDLQIKY